MFYVCQAKFEADPDGGFCVSFPDVPEAITQGDTKEEARENAAQVLGFALRLYCSESRSLPKRGVYKGGADIAAGAWSALKTAVTEAFAETGIRKTEPARRLGKAENAARRILDFNCPTKIQTLEKALNALGKQIIISVRNQPRSETA